ncbi:HD domain-containing phosphohydrolase [Desulfuromonas acetoxidans]|uniref:HD domain-containing phosphohydrolase n=1 Tax=Desulfuromonas acetoxidans TaxID=891 RepID=UPI00292E44FB|nr:HD domain-containing phosphohydrolase [Desulfuromonas acetoxidans]
MTLNERLERIHDQIQQSCNSVGRIAVALYDDKTDILHTFLSSSEENPFHNYQIPLSQVPSLNMLAMSGENRLISDIPASLSDSNSHHSKQIVGSGYCSSLTIPLKLQGKLLGFLFYDSFEKDDFSVTMQGTLNLYAQLICETISHDLASIKTLGGAVVTAREFSRQRDEETAAHLSRMAHYSRLIAMEVSDHYQISEETIEYLHQFAPLHDIGKVAIPDRILLKKGRLTDDEREVMRSHVLRGVEIIDLMIDEFDLGTVRHIELLRNIIAGHHERFDGSGYPSGQQGLDIPVESRIIAVADVFDALTTQRPYKPAWSFDEALTQMQTTESAFYDPACVAALAKRRDDVEAIRRRFVDPPAD